MSLTHHLLPSVREREGGGSCCVASGSVLTLLCREDGLLVSFN